MKKLCYALVNLLLCLLCFAPLSVNGVSADSGPKPSIHITFEGLEGKTYYATLLSKNGGVGPWNTWDENEDFVWEYHLKDGQTQEIFMKFVEYEDTDGYFFLCNLFTLREGKGLDWGYYPPTNFKLLVYDSQTDTFACSQPYEKYAFDSYYKADLSEMNFSQEGGENHSVLIKTPLKIVKEYDWGKELLGLLGRMLLTIGVEISLAFAFGLRGKGCWALIVLANVGTQILLNVALNIFTHLGGFMMPLVYLVAELAVFGIEAGVYCLFAPKIAGMKDKKKGVLVLYALAANATSFLLGTALSVVAGTDLLF